MVPRFEWTLRPPSVQIGLRVAEVDPTLLSRGAAVSIHGYEIEALGNSSQPREDPDEAPDEAGKRLVATLEHLSDELLEQIINYTYHEDLLNLAALRFLQYFPHKVNERNTWLMGYYRHLGSTKGPCTLEILVIDSLLLFGGAPTRPLGLVTELPASICTMLLYAGESKYQTSLTELPLIKLVLE
ncbi:MAG: hypothetical protein Q9181_003749 [Wetmoreana brouardii]